MGLTAYRLLQPPFPEGYCPSRTCVLEFSILFSTKPVNPRHKPGVLVFPILLCYNVPKHPSTDRDLGGYQ